jgi:plastocyanin
MKVDDDRLRKVLGLSRMSFQAIDHPIAVTDLPLESDSAAAGGAHAIAIDHFSFAPARAAIAVGTTVTWSNRDDAPHNIVSTERRFKSPVLDTGEQFSYRFEQPGTYKYFCSLHPRMTGEIEVGRLPS